MISRKNIIHLGRKTDPGPSSRRTRQTRVADGLKRKARTCLLLLLSVTTSAQADNTVNEPHFDFDIPRQRAALALTVFAEQANLTLIVPHELLEGKVSNELIGRYSLQEGIDILLDGTGLEPVISNHVVLSITAEAPADPGGTMKVKKKVGLLAVLASLFASGATADTPNDSSSGEQEPVLLEEIIVTGTLIRNANEGASPVFVFDREAIDRGGFATTQQFVESLPQNFGAGPNEDSFFQAADPIAARNSTFGSSINLRGLGATSTLVLINGKRLSVAGGTTGDFVDVSSIPLTAIDRVEVLTDGASATYGTDAIAGVVNFILRDDYEGGETKLRYGTDSGGGQEEVRLGQTVGKRWAKGNFLVSYEYYNRSHLGSEERSFAATSNLTSFGGDNFDGNFGTPANNLDPALGFQPGFSVPPGQDGTSLTPGDFLVGVVNRNNRRDGLDLMPDVERHSVFLTARQKLTTRSQLFGEIQFSRREFVTQAGPPLAQFAFVTAANPFYVSPIPGAPFLFFNYNFRNEFGIQSRSGDVSSYRGVLGGRFDVANTWQMELYGTYNLEESATKLDNTVNIARFTEALGSSDQLPSFDPTVDGFFNPFSDGGDSPQNVIDFIRGSSTGDIEGELWTAHIKADGQLFDVSGGAVQLAVGAEYRDEGFVNAAINDTSSPQPTASMFNTDGQRDVIAVFAELLIPLVGEGSAVPGVERLELSLASRYEDYSDFGSSSNPKIGLVWSPFNGLTLRSTYGTSFRAPKLTDVDEQLQLVLERSSVPDPLSATGFSTAIQLAGSNPDLQAEESTAWTFGLRVNPPSWTGFSLDVTYFDIEFDERIAEPADPFGFVFDPENFGSFFVRDPDDADVQALQNSPYFLGTPSIPPSEIVLVIDSRIQNFARTQVSGVDLNSAYNMETDSGSLSFGLNANYILEFENAFQPGAEFVDFVGTVNNPTDWRLRGNVSWSRNGWNASAFVNYTDSYDDTVSSPERSVDSWTTVDLQLQYETPGGVTPALLGNTVFSINVQNLFDEDPPFVNNPAGIGYDPNNASPVGASIAFQITKDW